MVERQAICVDGIVQGVEFWPFVHGLTEAVIAVTFDWTGFGSDGAVWGGEFLVGDFQGEIVECQEASPDGLKTAIIVDSRPVVRAILHDFPHQRDRPRIARRFHWKMAEV